MTEVRFTNREIDIMFRRMDEKFDEVNMKLDEHAETHEKILNQVLFTNGKLKKVTLWLTIVGTVSLTLLFTNGSELVNFILRII